MDLKSPRRIEMDERSFTNTEQFRFLTLLGQLPVRLTSEQAAWVLNCQLHDIPALVAARLLKPLGSPPPNGIKFFATADLLEASKDSHWLARMSATIYQHWRKKNARQNVTAGNGQLEVAVAN